MPSSYQRYFMALSESSNEFTMEGKKALGKCIIEAKGSNGKVILSVQNIKPERIYSAYIIAANESSSTAIEIGRIIPDLNGHGQTKWECNANNVENSGIALGSFNVAALMSVAPNSLLVVAPLVNAPLVGYKDGEINWKNELKIHSQKSALSTPAADAMPSQAPAPAEGKLLEPSSEQMKKTPVHESERLGFAPLIDHSKSSTLANNHGFSQPMEESSANDFFETIEEGSAEKTFKLMAQKINEKLSEIDALELEGAYKADSENTMLSMSLEIAEGLNMIFRNCSKIRPFKEIRADTQWIRITPNELIYLPKEYEYLQKDLFISEAYKKYGHLILGRKHEAETTAITLGLPDVYDKKNEKNASFSDLSEFLCCDCSDLLEGKHGYWLKSLRFGVNGNN